MLRFQETLAVINVERWLLPLLPECVPDMRRRGSHRIIICRPTDEQLGSLSLLRPMPHGSSPIGLWVCPESCRHRYWHCSLETASPHPQPWCHHHRLTPTRFVRGPAPRQRWLGPSLSHGECRASPRCGCVQPKSLGFAAAVCGPGRTTYSH